MRLPAQHGSFYRLKSMKLKVVSSLNIAKTLLHCLFGRRWSFF